MSPDILAPTLKCVILWFIIQSNYGALRGVLVPFRVHILRNNLTNVAAVIGRDYQNTSLDAYFFGRPSRLMSNIEA